MGRERPRVPFPLALLLGLMALGLLAAPAEPTHEEHGTWSLVAADPARGEVGVALASCVPSVGMVARRDGGYRLSAQSGGASFELAHLVPGRGAIVAQGEVDPENGIRLDRAATVLRSGGAPDQAIAAAFEGDAAAARRQYGAVTTAPLAHAVTGADVPHWAGHATGRSLSVQGNTLVGEDVVTGARSAFEAGSGSLADALLAGLAAGAAAGGDQRCPQQAALVAFLAVASTGDDGPQPMVWSEAAVSKGGEPAVAALERNYRSVRPSNIEGPTLALAAALVLGGVGLALAWLGRRARRT